MKAPLRMPQMARDFSAQGKMIICRDCKSVAPQKSPRQFYCANCSDERFRQRQAAYSKTAKPKARQAKLSAENRSAAILAGIEASVEASKSLISVDLSRRFQPSWYVRFRIPNAGTASKNFIYGLGGEHGHVYKRQQSKAFQASLAAVVANAVRQAPIVTNKVWIEIFVQKENHKSDAVNVVDLVCDAIKLGIKVDDRWFSIARLDWEIVKRDPYIYVGIFQEATEHAQACSCCGQIAPLSAFPASKGSTTGHHRMCRECSTRGRAITAARRLLNKAEASL